MTQMTTEEHEWLQQYRLGNSEALGRLIEQYRRPLFKFLLNMVHDMDLAEEIYQDVWLRAIRNLHRFNGTNMLSWLFKIAHNRMIDHHRKKKPLTPLDSTSEDGRTLYESLPSSEPDPAQHVSARDLGTRIAEAVAELPDEQREVFLLRQNANLSFKEIARIQHVSINTALGRMHYAMQHLRDLLQDEYIQGGAS